MSGKRKIFIYPVSLAVLLCSENRGVGSGRHDSSHPGLATPRVVGAVLWTTSWLGDMRKPTPVLEAGHS